MVEQIEIELILNGTKKRIMISPNETLLHVLRDKLHVKSVKAGCLRGECGTCTVIMNNRLVKSCLILALEANGAEIITLEGLSDIQKISPLQKAFIEKFGFQCGFCTPGFILTGYWILKNKPKASLEEIKEIISGILCRCTGYKQVIDSIIYAKEMKL